MTSPYTEASIRKAMREGICRDYEGHVPTPTLEHWGETYSSDGTYYTPFLCKKCKIIVYLKNSSLEAHPFKMSRPTPRYP